MIRPATSIDAFSAAAYADEAAIAARFKEMRAQGDVLWVEQEPYRPFWAVLRHKDVMDIERNGKLWLNAPRLTLLPDWFEDRTIAQFGTRTGPVRTLLDMDGALVAAVESVPWAGTHDRITRRLIADRLRSGA